MDTKKMGKLNINNFVKDSPLRPRLQSLRLPRDLSLGGTKSSKKNFKPNLNVIRHKEKVVGKVEKPKNRNSHLRERPKDRFVQSSGVFSDGIGDVNRPPQNRVYVREKRPALRQERQSFSNISSSDRVFKEIATYEEDSDDSDRDVKVPFKPVRWDAKKLLEDPPMKESNVSSQEELAKVFLKRCDPLNDALSLSLWQLPDALCFKNDSNVKKSGDCGLCDLPEGKIGKVCVRKSGKITVCVGSLEFELEPEGFGCPVEEVVSIDASAEEPKAVVLGEIDNMFLLVPS
ncbi:hypothetical protein NQ318_013287 [Aromia moschata]|uniref:DNA-directed RNA polymerase III subunit RPC4 n=1 Tax=Aromia moschata TaxID=1265417 RepID=A0AAV8XSA9_9CUCU|nr:hypothetical protein NQ318_013287 [Aromia moschata]